MQARLSICALLAVLLSVLPLSVDTTAAAQECDQNCATELVRTGQVMPLGQIIVSAGIAQLGEILDAQLFERNGDWFYAFRMLNKADNNVFGVIVNARNGTIVSGGR